MGSEDPDEDQFPYNYLAGVPVGDQDFALYDPTNLTDDVGVTYPYPETIFSAFAPNAYEDNLPQAYDLGLSLQPTASGPLELPQASQALDQSPYYSSAQLLPSSGDRATSQ